MAFLGEPFRHDIFVTYSHGPLDQKGKGVFKPWSVGFVERLQSELLVEAGNEQIRLFLDAKDRDGDGTDPIAPLSKQLQENVQRCGLLMILMSQSYLDSKWCRDEREWWFEAQRKLDYPTENRIAVVRIVPTKGAWPKELLDAEGNEPIGFDFVDLSFNPARPRGWPIPTLQSGVEFSRMVVHLAGQLRQRLSDLAEIVETRRREAEAQRQTAEILYLHGRQADELIWQDTKKTLRHQGFKVVPSATEPHEASSLAESFGPSANRVNIMRGCHALLLLGTNVSALDEDIISIGKFARDAAIAKAERTIPCAVLDVGGITKVAADAVNTAGQFGIRWIDGTAASWPEEVRTWLSPTST